MRPEDDRVVLDPNAPAHGVTKIPGIRIRKDR